MIDDLERAKRTRVDMQYYVAGELDAGEIKGNVEAARRFVLDAEKAAMSLTSEQIEKMRQELKALMHD